jgi:hypothetical protein
MRYDDAQSLAFGLLAASRALVDGISAGVAARGFDDVRPAHGFVERHPHPGDARARLITLTSKGRACTRAAEEATAETIRPWVSMLGERRLLALRDDLIRIAPGGPLRPAW